MTSLAERCYDADVRVGRIIHIATMFVDTPDDDTAVWVAEMALEQLNERFGWDLDDSLSYDEISQALVGEDGWLIEAATPKTTEKRTISGGSMTLFSWQSYHSQVFHGDTFEEAVEKALAWAAEVGPGRDRPRRRRQ